MCEQSCAGEDSFQTVLGAQRSKCGRQPCLKAGEGSGKHPQGIGLDPQNSKEGNQDVRTADVKTIVQNTSRRWKLHHSWN